jgi:hypothetical protein
MRNLAERLTAIAGSVLFCFTVPAFGQTTINFTGITNSQVFGGGYVDPYAGTVTYNGAPVSNGGLIVCDDYKDEIYIPETWNVTAIQASSLNSSNIGETLFGSAIGLDGYAAVASLVADLLSSSSQSTQADLSSAIWWITSGWIDPDSNYSLSGYPLDPAAVGYITSALTAYGPFGQGDDTTAANTALAADTNLWVLTPISGTQSTGGPPQEMWIQVSNSSPDYTPLFSNVPEGGTALTYLLLAGATCFGAVYFNSRSRLGRAETA